MSNTPPKVSEEVCRRKYFRRNLACRHPAFKKRNWKPIWERLGVLFCWNGLPKDIPAERLEPDDPLEDGTKVYFDKTRLYGVFVRDPGNGIFEVLIDPSQPTKRIWAGLRKEICALRGPNKKPNSGPRAGVPLERMFKAYDLWKKGHTYPEVAQMVSASPSRVKDWCNKIEEELRRASKNDK